MLHRLHLLMLALASLLWSGLASARTDVRPKAGIGGLDLVVLVVVGVQRYAEPGKYRASAFACGDFAVGYSLIAGGAACGLTTIHKTVAEGERAACEAGGAYEAALGGIEGKYFYPTAQQAQALVGASFPSQGIQMLTSVSVPKSVLRTTARLHVVDECPVLFLRVSSSPAWVAL